MSGVYRNSVISGLFHLVRHLLAFSSLRVDLPFYLTFPNFRSLTRLLASFFDCISLVVKRISVAPLYTI